MIQVLIIVASELLLFLLQERLKFMESFSKRTELSALLASDVRQNTLNIAEQIFSVYTMT